MNLVGLYFRVELFSWTHGAREVKSTSSYVAIQNLLEYPPKWGFLLLPLGYHVSWTHMGGAPGTEPNRAVFLLLLLSSLTSLGTGRRTQEAEPVQCSKLLDHARELAVCVEIY